MSIRWPCETTSKPNRVLLVTIAHTYRTLGGNVARGEIRWAALRSTVIPLLGVSRRREQCLLGSALL